MSRPSELGPTGLRLDHDKLLDDCSAILKQVGKDSDRLRAKLANVPWDIVNTAGQGYLEKARTNLMLAEGSLLEARKQLEHQRDRARNG